MPFFEFPAFLGTGRADRVEKHLVTRALGGSRKQWLYLCGPTEAAAQVLAVAEDGCVQTPVTADRRREYSHRFEFADGVPREIIILVEVMETFPTLASHQYLDLAMVLDWYKVVDDQVDPQNWKNTDAGELVYRGKYYKPPSRPKELARGVLIDQLTQLVQRHPLYSRTTSIVTVPGSAANFESFGEGLAHEVGRRCDKQVVWTESRLGPRQPRKEAEGPIDLMEAFAIPVALRGPILIIDDVFRTGATMSSVALAARRAGAESVYGLAAVKTMRS